MFIEIKDHLIPEREILYIKRVGWGLKIVTRTGTIEAIDVMDEEYNNIKRKLCCEPEVITFNQPKFTKEFEEEVMSMKLCNRKKCYDCEHYEFILNKVDNTEPSIHVCKMQKKELLDDLYLLPTPYNFFTSEYHYKEEE